MNGLLVVLLACLSCVHWACARERTVHLDVVPHLDRNQVPRADVTLQNTLPLRTQSFPRPSSTADAVFEAALRQAKLRPIVLPPTALLGTWYATNDAHTQLTLLATTAPGAIDFVQETNTHAFAPDERGISIHTTMLPMNCGDVVDRSYVFAVAPGQLVRLRLHSTCSLAGFSPPAWTVAPSEHFHR